MIRIDSEFQTLIPPLADDEFEFLEKSILSEGVREPIITWNSTIIDGHNRYRICQSHGLECPNREREFSSRDAAKIWIIENQFGRRNLKSYVRGVLALQLKPLYAAEAKRRQATSTGGANPQLVQKSSHADESGKTRDKLAEIAGISHDTLRKVELIEQEANSGNKTAIAARDSVMNGGKSINKAFSEIRDEGKRICTQCGKPIDNGDCYKGREYIHKRCDDARRAQQQYKNPDISLIENVADFSIESLFDELVSVAENLRDSWNESIEINESQGVKLSSDKKERLEKAVANLFETLSTIKEDN